MDVRVVGNGQNEEPVVALQVRPLARANAIPVMLVNASGDQYNAGGGGSGGDGSILDGADTSLKATVKNYANAKPLAVVLVNVSGDVYNSSGGGGAASNVNINQVGGTATDVNAGDAGAGTQRVVLASDQPPVSVRQSGTWSTAVTGDVLFRAGQPTLTVVHAGPVGVQVVGGSIGAQVYPSGDSMPVRQSGGWSVTHSGPVGVQVVGGAVGAKVSPSGDSLPVSQQGAWAVAGTGDFSTTPKAGQTWPVREQNVVGTQIVGQSQRLGVSGDVVVSGTDIDTRPLDPSQDSVRVHGGRVGVTGDMNSTLADGADTAVRATVRDYAGSNPLAVVLTNVSGDTYSPEPREPILVTRSGRVTSAGTVTVAGPYAGRVIKVTSYDVQAESDTAQARWGSGASGESLSPQWLLASREGVAKQVSGVGGGYIFKTQLGQALVLENAGANFRYSVTFSTGDSI